VAILNFQMAQTVTTHVKDIHNGEQHFHLLLENNQTEFNQAWQRCFL
jgi:hypothetical protein